MEEYQDYKDLNIKERIEKFIPNPYQDMAEVLIYEEQKINHFVPIKYSGLINKAMKELVPFTKGILNPKSEVLGFLKLSGIGNFDDSTIKDFNTYEELLKSKEELNKNELNKVEKLDLVHFFIENFGFDFTEAYHESKKVDSKEIRCNDNKINYGHLVNHISNIKTLYKKPYIHSKIIRIEINPESPINKDTDLSLSDMIGWVIGFTNLKPFYIERSKNWNGTAIVYCELSKYMSDYKKERLENYFRNKYRIDFHIQRSEEYCLLPYSAEYQFRGSYNIKNRFRVDQKSFFDILENTMNRTINPVTEIEKMIGTLDLGIVIKKVDSSGDFVKKSSTDSLETRSLNRFSYGEGTRYSTQTSLSMFCAVQRAKLSEFIRIAYLCNDGSSKDMRNWTSERIVKYLENLYIWAKSNVVIKDRVDEEELGEDENNRTKKVSYNIRDNGLSTWLDNEDAAKEFKSYLSLEFDKIKKTKRERGLWKTYFINDALNLYKFMIRKRKFDAINDHSYEKGYEALNEGVLISQGMFKDLAKHLNFKRNFKEVLYFLQDIGLLSKVYIGKYSHSYKKKIYATHYKVMNCLKELLKLVSSICSIFSSNSINIKYNKLINIQNSSKTLCINYIVNVRFQRLLKRRKMLFFTRI